MQYLECLASALDDMSHTYQPAASMSSILQAVMLELQNASAKSPPEDKRYERAESRAVAIPARRESNSSGADNSRSFKKRQLSKSSIRPPSSITIASTAPSLDFSRTPQSTATTASLGLKGNGIGMGQSGGDEMERNYVVIPAGTGSERTAWPSLTSDLNVLDYPMSFTRMDMGGGQNWMDILEGASPITGMGQGNGGGAEGKNTELDFFSF